MGAQVGTGKDRDAEALVQKLQEYERWFKVLDGQMRLLELERQKLSAVVNNSDAAFLTFDASHSIAWANEEFRRRFGDGSVTGKRCCDALCRQDSPCQSCPVVRAFQSGTVSHREIRLDMNGAPRDIYATAMPIKTPEGGVGEAIVMLQDVSDLEVLRRSQLALETSERKFRSIFQHAAAGMTIVSPEGLFLEANAAFCEFLGYPKDELLGMNVFEITHPEDRGPTRSAFGTVGKRTWPAVVKLEKRYVRKDGRVVWGHLTIAWIFDDEGRPLHSVGLCEDVTERKTAEEALRRSEEKLRQAQKMEAIGTLAGGLAHDFNNILAGILGQAEMLNLVGSGDPKIAAASEVIKNASRRGAELTRQLLGFARGGKQQNLPVDLHGTIQEVVALLSRTIDKRVALKTEFEVDRAVTRGDPGQLQQVVLNLALNARDAMPDGGELIFRTEVADLDESFCEKHAGARPGRFLRLSVIDSGCGIGEEIKDRLFEPFFTTKEKGKGTGMGLAMVYGIVVNHGGSIQMDSKPGFGTTVTVHLPSSEADARTEPAEPRTDVTMGSGKILVVDDEEIVRDVAKGFLTHAGYEVITAHNGQEAVEIYRRRGHEIRLVILDMVMPKMGGRECFRALKEMNPAIRAVLSTGHGFSVVAQEMLEEGMVGFVPKPYELRHLTEAVAKALRK